MWGITNKKNGIIRIGKREERDSQERVIIGMTENYIGLQFRVYFDYVKFMKLLLQEKSYVCGP